MSGWSTVISKLAEATGEELVSPRLRRAGGGGCISDATILESRGRRFFVKHNRPALLEMFAAEAEGLAALAAARAVRVPTPICWGAGPEMAFLALEYLDLSACGEQAHAALGRGLAAMHRVTRDQSGWHRPNTIGTTPQVNTYSRDWLEFFRDRRLGYQLDLAGRRGNRRLLADGEKLLSHLGSFFDDHRPTASLLHGDLWSGNVAEASNGEPVIFDPAVYFGDRETDLAMTELFGGFPESFYRGYNDAWPLSPGYVTRRTIYNLYHVLNHLNLFGRGYLEQAQRMIGELLAEIR